MTPVHLYFWCSTSGPQVKQPSQGLNGLVNGGNPWPLRVNSEGGMMVCRLCGLTLDEIPEDAIQCGKLYRFVNGEYHYLRKKLAPRTGPRPRKNRNPDQEAPQEPVGTELSGTTVPSTPPAMGSNAREVPAPVTFESAHAATSSSAAPTKQKNEKTEKEETTLPTETLMEKAFRLIGTYTEKRND
jgi:hypothetical protein